MNADEGLQTVCKREKRRRGGAHTRRGGRARRAARDMTNRRNILSIAGPIALLVGVLAFSGRPAVAQSVGELSPGMVMNKGWLAIAVPPIRVIDGRRVVVVSAPESEWDVTNLGPFLDVADCGSALSRYARGSLLESDYEKFKEGRRPGASEAQILADVQQRSARCIQSDGSERFRTPGRFEKDPTTDFVK